MASNVCSFILICLSCSVLFVNSANTGIHVEHDKIMKNMKCGKSVQIDLDTQSKLLEVAKKHGLDLTSFNIGILDNEAAKENKRQTILQAMDLLRNIIINKDIDFIQSDEDMECLMKVILMLVHLLDGEYVITFDE